MPHTNAPRLAALAVLLPALASLHCGSDDGSAAGPSTTTTTGTTTSSPSACDAVDCGDHGTCVDGGCVCDGGYTGDGCDEAVECQQRCLDAGHTAGTCRTPPPPSDATLFFRSGFEEPVTMTKGNSSADLHGADDGFDWDDLDSYFNFVAADAEALGLVETRFSESGEPVHGGARSLYQAQWSIQDGAQNRLQFFGEDSVFGPHIFSRRWLYWPDTNEMFVGDSGGTSINGVRQVDNSLSVYVSLGNDDGELYWQARCLDYTAGPSYYNDRLQWILDNRDFAVPMNRWFRMDFYVYRHPTEGIFRMWIDDDLVFDITPESPPHYRNWPGPGVMTKNNDTDRWFSKLADIDGGTEFEQWVDDVEIWQNGIPASPEPCNPTETDLGASGCTTSASCCCGDDASL